VEIAWIVRKVIYRILCVDKGVWYLGQQLAQMEQNALKNIGLGADRKIGNLRQQPFPCSLNTKKKNFLRIQEIDNGRAGD